MTPQEHYEQAEQLLHLAVPHSSAYGEHLLRQAQVHATLATARVTGWRTSTPAEK